MQRSQGETPLILLSFNVPVLGEAAKCHTRPIAALTSTCIREGNTILCVHLPGSLCGFCEGILHTYILAQLCFLSAVRFYKFFPKRD